MTLTLWERAVGDDEGRMFVGRADPGPDCFSCSHLRASDACAAVVSLAAAGDIDGVVRVVEYRMLSSDPHLLCDAHVLADDRSLATRIERCRARTAPTNTRGTP